MTPPGASTIVNQSGHDRRRGTHAIALLGSLGLLSSRLCGLLLFGRGGGSLGGGVRCSGCGLGIGRSPESLLFFVNSVQKFKRIGTKETYQVVTQQLHNQSRVLVALLGQGVELCEVFGQLEIYCIHWHRHGHEHTRNSIVEGLLGQVASLVGSVEDLVVEHREVEGEAETNGVRRRKLSLSNLGGSLVGIEGLVGRVLALVANGKLGQVSVVVTLPVIKTLGTDLQCMHANAPDGGLHLVVKHLGLSGLSRGNQVLVKNLKDVLADLGELCLNLLAVLLDQADLRAVAL